MVVEGCREGQMVWGFAEAALKFVAAAAATP